MASRKPVKETANKEVRIPFADSFDNRSGVLTKDARMYNCFPEKKKNALTEKTDITICKRPGLNLVRAYGAGTARGCFRWNSADYVAIGGTLYKDGASHQAIAGTSGHVGFTLVGEGRESRVDLIGCKWIRKFRIKAALGWREDVVVAVHPSG